MFIKLAQLTRFWTNAKNYIADGYVAKETGRGLSTNDLTATLKTNYDAAYTHSRTNHAPAGAQANVIETIKLNGTALTPSSKAVNITVPTKVSELSDANDYAKKSQLGNVYKYSGSVANYAALPTLVRLEQMTPLPYMTAPIQAKTTHGTELHGMIWAVHFPWMLLQTHRLTLSLSE